MNPISKQFSSIEQITGQYLKQKNVTSPSKTSDVSFEDVLRQQQQLKFSAVRKQKYQLIRGTECQTLRRSGTGICQGN